MKDFDQARRLLHDFKAGTYLYGMGVLPQVGATVARLGRRAALIGCQFPGCASHMDAIRRSARDAEATLAGEINGAAPNAPREDLARITDELRALEPARSTALRPTPRAKIWRASQMN